MSTSSFSSDLSEASLFGLSLSSYRDHNLGPDATSYFENEAAISAISILFFRTTVHQSGQESTLLRYFFAVILAALAYFKRSYFEITAVELFSYAAAHLLRSRIKKSGAGDDSGAKDIMIRLFYLVVSAAVSMGLSHLLVSGLLLQGLTMVTPSPVIQLLYYLFPIAEMQRVYDVAIAFADPEVLSKQLSHLLFVTFHIQVGMGFLGIEFLRREQHRRNQLVRMDVEGDTSDTPAERAEDQANADASNNEKSLGDDQSRKLKVRLQRSRRFQRGAAPFILFTAFPYMMQIIFYGGMNKYSFMCVQHDLHRTVRLNELFDHDSHLIATATETATSPDAYAASMDLVMSTAYDIFNRKLFSLPKVLLLPGVMAKQPWLVAQVVPFIFLSDFVKAYAVAYVTKKIEDFQKQIQELSSIRSKVEAFDMKNAELLQRSGTSSTLFTQRRWERLTVQIQARQVVSDLLTRSKLFFAFMQRNFVFGALIDCALANLLAIGKITSADTFVFSRAVEDAVDMILTRSRAEAELGRMSTEQDKLDELSGIWARSKKRMLLPCHVDPIDHDSLVFRNLHYTRGTAAVRADHVELPKGVYALTGANGSGKSTLFRIIMSCNTNEKPIDLPPSINLLTPAEPLTEADDLMREVACEANEAAKKDPDEAIETEPSPEIEVPKECSANTDDQEPGASQECIAPKVADEASDTRGLNAVPRLSVTMPSAAVSEISQNFYWPLYSKPVEFFFQSDLFEDLSEKEIDDRAMLVATELHSLHFFQPVTKGENSTDVDDKASIVRIADELKEEKEDWFSDLSGGQKSKAELVRLVFLQDVCPGVLLVDETMAPLDPASKQTVMAKLKSFCMNSIIIVIYHADATQDASAEGAEAIECVPSSGFFDHNIHLDQGNLHIKPTC